MNNRPTPSICFAHPNRDYLNYFKNEWGGSSSNLADVSRNGITGLRMILRKKPDYAILYSGLTKLETFVVIREVKKRGLKTKFCVLYDEQPTVDDFIIAKSLRIERSVFYSGSIKDLVEKVEGFIYARDYVDPFINITVDSWAYKIKQLGKSKLELLCLLTVYDEMTPLLKKTNLNQEGLEKEMSSICDALGFCSSNQLKDWCQENINLIVNLATQAA